MISLEVDGCKVDILTVVNGLVSETEKVREGFGDYEAYAAALSIEGVQTLRNRANIEDEFDVSELDLVYIHHMERFGKVEIPSPAMYTFIDAVTAKGMHVIPLDMNDEDFTEIYCKNVKTMEFMGEHRLAKKGLKTEFKSENPEDFAREWDTYVNTLKGYAKLSRIREQYMADQIRDIDRFRKSLLAIVEVERADGIAALLR